MTIPNLSVGQSTGRESVVFHYILMSFMLPKAEAMKLMKRDYNKVAIQVA